MEATIIYTPFGEEIDFNHPTFPLSISPDHFVLPADKNSDPFMWAEKCIIYFEQKKITPTILIPGKKFDLLGTRHGKGGGWYDRFLSHIPISWQRVGIAEKSQISSVPLLRQNWDEPLDWIIVRDDVSWVLHETHARCG
jgi:hypothetical protein